MLARVKTASRAVYNHTVLAHATDHAAAAELHSAKAGEGIEVDRWQQAAEGSSCVLAHQWGQTGLHICCTLVYIHTAQRRRPVVALTAARGVGRTAQGAIVAGQTVTDEPIGTGTGHCGLVRGTGSTLMARLTIGDL